MSQKSTSPKPASRKLSVKRGSLRELASGELRSVTAGYERRMCHPATPSNKGGCGNLR